MKKKLEICVEGIDQAIVASKKGADRIELCENLKEGGTTPTMGTLKIYKKLLDKTPSRVLIRPNSSWDFNYSSYEFEVMKEDIKLVKELQFEGLVFGILTEDKEIDFERCQELIRLASPLKSTFHMAFDETKDFKKSLEDIIKCGFDTLLTKGGKKGTRAIENLEKLSEIYKLTNDRIILMPGGGINPDNLNQFTWAKWIHGTKLL